MDSLPVSQLDSDKINISVHKNKATQEETVVLIKRTIKSFIYRADNYYRDSGSKRNNFTN